jgi:hypothetical protein
LHILQLLLESDGHERIASASGGNEAIALLDKEKDFPAIAGSSNVPPRQ